MENGNKKVLLVEDDKFLGGLITQKFSKAGIDVYTATNGEETLEMLKENKVAVVVLDILLPGSLSGFDVLREIKENPDTKDIKVIMLSNLDKKEDSDKATELGASDYMIKAVFSPDDIIQKITEILNSIE